MSFAFIGNSPRQLAGFTRADVFMRHADGNILGCLELVYASRDFSAIQ